MSVGGFYGGAPTFSGMNGAGLGSLGLTGSGFMAIGGALSSAIGGFFASEAQKYQLETQAIIARTNARIAERGAQSTLDKGNKDIASLTLKAGQVKSAQRAAMAANGIDLGVGSAAETLASTEIMKEIDKNTLNANAVRSAWGQRLEGVSFQNEAIASQNAANSISPWMNAATSLLGSASEVSSQWYKPQRGF